jgi:hypothetical protein
MLDALSISALVVSVITALSGLIAGMHIKKSKCLGNECLCESEETKTQRIKSVIEKQYSGNITPISKDLKIIRDLSTDI